MEEIKKLIENIQIGNQTVFDVAEKVNPDGKAERALTVTTRKVLPEAPREPKKAESARRQHSFYDAGGFMDYLTKYGTQDTVIFGDPQNSRCTAVLEETATKGREMVVFTPMPHPLWVPWEASIVGRRVPLDFFIDFIGMNRRVIVEPNGRDLMIVLSQVKATTEKTVHRGRGKQSLNGLLVKLEIQGVKKDEIVELPEVLKLAVPLYVKTAPRMIELDLMIETESDGEQIVVQVSSGALMEAKFQAFEIMLEELNHLAEGEKGMTVVLGAPQYQAWDYLKEIPQ